MQNNTRFTRVFTCGTDGVLVLTEPENYRQALFRTNVLEFERVKREFSVPMRGDKDEVLEGFDNEWVVRVASLYSGAII